ncbi:NADH-quinone oxidoreductase subunit NuoB [Breoghania sp. JC706]|uniref:NADH-quinone oxidoreductase subunit B family protein n=1 Tax=Breoghania sp. JC706 TaxID=3117732 RepID=UPI0030089A1F
MGVLTKLFSSLMATSRRKSPWIYTINSGSCNGCDIEIGPCISPRYDAEQIGMLRHASPKHADILVVTGAVSKRIKPALLDIYSQMPSPKAVVAVGSCPASCNVFAGSPVLDGPLDKFIPVDIWVPGCPPRPQLIIDGIAKAAQMLADGQTADQLGKKVAAE